MKVRLLSAVLSGLVFAVMGGLVVRAAREASRRGAVRALPSVWLQEETPVYEVHFREEVRPKPKPGGGADGRPEVPGAAPRPFGNVLALAPDLLDPPRKEASEADLLRMPGVIFSDSSDGRGSSGTGSGSGGGSGGGIGSGRGTGSSRDDLRSAYHKDGIPLQIEDMTVDYREIPLFPKPAKAAHLAGNVVIQVLVSEDGHPMKCEVVSSANDLFRDEVLRVMPMWRFKPTLVRGEKVRVKVQVLFVFTYDEFST